MKKRVFITFFVLMIFVCLFSKFSYAASTIKDIETEAGSFISKGKGEAGTDAGTVITSVGENFIGIGRLLILVGAGVLIGAVSLLGIQYLMASPDKKAALKEKLIALVIATFIIFGAYNIWSMTLDVVSNFD